RGARRARLCSVAPYGSSRLVTTGPVTLTPQSSHEHPAPLTPGRQVTADFPLLATAHRFAPGHRLRLSISASFWPNLWPSPKTTLITVNEVPELSLPLRTVTSADDDARTSSEVTALLATPPAPPVSSGTPTGPEQPRGLLAQPLALPEDHTDHREGGA